MKKWISLFIAMFMMACNNDGTTSKPHDLDNTDVDDTAIVVPDTTRLTDSVD